MCLAPVIRRDEPASKGYGLEASKLLRGRMTLNTYGRLAARQVTNRGFVTDDENH